ncbi:GAF and ANTAR domain-containing protein [Gordonia sp. KTR9]|uniref:GAF and ANTAR domain-containing protein n=1 Tax=Gordonia sp. KTR9 TaxID=337191 RepID=UPI00027DD907|nr:GAF and ANTAR domain-containing protein [Gordonia sp. KTR9]AFR46864.1 ANTAR domain-containing protein [Gordonia sp. KTR9]
MTELADFGAQMTRIAGEMRKESDDTEAALRSMTKFAVDAIPGAEYATVTLVSEDTVETPVMVGDLGGEADRLQRELGEGPCLRAAVGVLTVCIHDMRTEPRWPAFASAAAELGIRSMACFYLYIDGDNSGALNLHSTVANAFTMESLQLGELFAAHAATALGAVQEKEQLRTALSSRDIIGQAKGMIMERYRLGANEAFALLARLSQDTNTKLVDVAVQIVEAGPES